MKYVVKFINEQDIIIGFESNSLDEAKALFDTILCPCAIFDNEDKVLVRNHVNDHLLEEKLGIETEKMLDLFWLNPDGKKCHRPMWASEANAAFEKLVAMAYPCYTAVNGKLLRKFMPNQETA